MNSIGTVLCRAADQLSIIHDLEEEEERCIAFFQIQFPHPNSRCIFDAGIGHQKERSRLYAVRLQIYTCSIAFKGFLDDIEQLQPQQERNQCVIVARAREMHAMLFQTMMKRRDDLIVEKRTYQLHRHAVNDGHANLNSRMADDITSTFR